MMRNRILAVAAVLGLLGGLAVLASPGSAGPVDPITVTRIDGTYPQVGPVGSGLTDVFLSQGKATSPQVPAFAFSVSNLELMSGPGGTIQIGSPAAGPPTLTLANPSNAGQMAVFDLPTTMYWGSGSHPGATLDARVFLASNTFADLNFSAFKPPEGGEFALSTKGIEIDSFTNTVTVSPGATASFSLTAVPEPASAVLMLAAGAAALAGLGLRRLRRRPAG
jgi:hypothetical protein